MINHVRTLLLNSKAGTADTEIVPADFAPVTLTGSMRTLDAIIFGSATPRQALVDAYMRVLHTPELEQFTLAFDPRITYARTLDASLADLCVNGYTRADMSATLSGMRGMLLRTGFQLFTWDAQQDRLDKLRTVWNTSLEGILKLGSGMLAYAYQLERLRL